jgi:hypothetical protein
MEKGNKEGGVVEWGHAPVFLIPAVTSLPPICLGITGPA